MAPTATLSRRLHGAQTSENPTRHALTRSSALSEPLRPEPLAAMRAQPETSSHLCTFCERAVAEGYLHIEPRNRLLQVMILPACFNCAVPYGQKAVDRSGARVWYSSDF